MRATWKPLVAVVAVAFAHECVCIGELHDVGVGVIDTGVGIQVEADQTIGTDHGRSSAVASRRAASPTLTVAEIMTSEPELSRFVEVVDLIVDNKNIRFARRFFTMLLPSNEAMGNFNQALLNQFDGGRWREQSRLFVESHILLDPDTFIDAVFVELLRRNEFPFWRLTGSPSGDFTISTFDGTANVIRSIPATNGIVHIIDSVITSRWMRRNLAQSVSDDVSSTNFRDMLQEEGLLDLIDTNAGYTAFLVTNPEMNRALLNPLYVRHFEDPVLRRNLLLQHIVNDPFDRLLITENENENAVPITLLGQELTFTRLTLRETENAVIVGGGSFLGISLVASNGYFHFVTSPILPTTALERLVLDDDLANFHTIVAYAPIALNALKLEPNVTVFAPRNSAISDLASLFREKRIPPGFAAHAEDFALRYIVTGQIVTTESMNDGDQLRTLDANPLLISVTEPGGEATSSGDPSITINGIATIVKADITSFNLGVVHTIDAAHVPLWFGMSIVDVVSTNDSLRTLAMMIQRSPQLKSKLVGETDVTLMAPTDEAFQKLEQQDPAAYAKLLDRPDLIFDIIDGHMSLEVASINQIDFGVTWLAAQNGRVFNLERSSTELTVNGVKVLETNFLASNGIVHIIEGLVLPENFDLADLVVELPSQSPSSEPSSTPSIAPSSSHTDLPVSLPTSVPTSMPTPASDASTKPAMALIAGCLAQLLLLPASMILFL